ncbi:MAG: SusD/RagB family nutrient-binding outer membrane lipoprotein [Dysgonamonadaceae bacterium]|jgi:hypothetical protein|nr:SusD/RagB family nutrient-binding outer membrane lipoprotein [Dysgonamonadaceae bacterium]
MKNIKFLAICFFLSGVFCACGDFGDINVNPNSPDSSVDYNFQEAALGSIFRTSVPAIEGDDEQRVKSLMVDFYAQMLDGGNFDTRYYIMNDDWNARMFRRVQNGISNMNLVLRGLAEQEESKIAYSKAVAIIWRVWTASVGVDWFGPIPFANYEGEVVENPPYLSVQEIYTQFFTELDKANALLLSESPNPVFNNEKYDIIFGNDKEKWRKFGNSIHLRLALRLSEVDAGTCKTEAAKALAAGVMESAADNAKLPPKADGGWGADYNYTMFQITWGGPLNMTTSMEKLLTGIGGMDFPTTLTNKRGGTPLSAVHPAKVDPRGPVMFDPAFGSKENGVYLAGSGDWKGRPDGLNISNHAELNPIEYQSTNFAELGILYSGSSPYKSRPYDLFLYEEICFLKAEAALRGFISGDAKSLYEEGVRASFATWGVSSQADNYLSSTEKNLAGTSAKYDDNTGAGNTQLEKIITQKYLALFPDMSQEAWNDKRRLNLPRTDVALDRYTAVWPTQSTDVKNVANYIKRVQYPNSEIQGNDAEYKKGLQLLGGADRVDTKIWWDKGVNYCTSAN